jgi:hypothetical protein
LLSSVVSSSLQLFSGLDGTRRTRSVFEVHHLIAVRSGLQLQRPNTSRSDQSDAPLTAELRCLHSSLFPRIRRGRRTQDRVLHTGPCRQHINIQHKENTAVRNPDASHCSERSTKIRDNHLLGDFRQWEARSGRRLSVLANNSRSACCSLQTFSTPQFCMRLYLALLDSRQLRFGRNWRKFWANYRPDDSMTRPTFFAGK